MVLDAEPAFRLSEHAGRAPDGGAPSSGQPEARRPRYVIVVARDQPDLWWHLRQSLRGLEGVDLVLDRRQGGRLPSAQSWEDQEWSADRRRPAVVETGLAGHSVLMVQPAASTPIKPKP